MTTTELFQSKKPLLHWWAKIIDDPMFAEVILHARSEFIERGPTELELRGARLYEIILTNLTQPGPSDMPIPDPGLHHQVEQIPPMPGAPAPPPKPQLKQVKRKK